jgi:hypothetical protein
VADPNDTTDEPGLTGASAPVGWMPRVTQVTPTSPLTTVGAPILNTPPSSAAAATPLVGGSGANAPATSPSGANPLLRSAGSGDVSDFLVQHESGGKFDASNAASGAYGLGQFTAATAKTVAGRHPELPSLNDFYSADPKVAIPAQQAYIKAHAADQAKVLTSQGLDATPGNIHMNWFLGESGGPKFLKAMQANPNATGASLALPGQVDANREVFFKSDGTPRTASEVYAAINGGTVRANVSGAGATIAPPTTLASAEAPPNAAGPIADQMKLQMLRGMFPQHAITPVEHNPFEGLSDKLSKKVDVNLVNGGGL